MTSVLRNAPIHANADAALEAKARELLANQLPSQRKRAVLLSGRPATYAGGITATQALRAICSALKQAGCW